jgi:hypothetical protein
MGCFVEIFFDTETRRFFISKRGSQENRRPEVIPAFLHSSLYLLSSCFGDSKAMFFTEQPSTNNHHLLLNS